MVYFAFDVHRVLPINWQWFYASMIIVLFIFLFQGVWGLFFYSVRDPLLKGMLTISITSICMLGWYQISSMNRKSEALSFLLLNNRKLKEVIVSEKNGKNVSQVLNNLNIRLIKGKDQDYHFELYSFLGYGYRILFTEDAQMEKPRSPGGSPTLMSYRLKPNWFYYSYFD